MWKCFLEYVNQFTKILTNFAKFLFSILLRLRSVGAMKWSLIIILLEILYSNSKILTSSEFYSTSIFGVPPQNHFIHNLFLTIIRKKRQEIFFSVKRHSESQNHRKCSLLLSLADVHISNILIFELFRFYIQLEFVWL